MSEMVQVKELQHKTPFQYFQEGYKKYNRIVGPWAEGCKGRCALGVVLSEQGWDGKSRADLLRGKCKYPKQLSHLASLNEGWTQVGRQHTFEEIDTIIQAYNEFIREK
jgi:hypothetical protein